MQNRSYQLINKSLTEIKKDILATLAYFDLFSYPLTRVEVFLFLKNKYDKEEFDHALARLLDSGLIHQFDKFYTLRNDHYLVVRRNEGNTKAAEMIAIAEKIGSLLIKFPYVRGVAISGSLSKNFADENSDIDLFIITEKNRLWIARTIMHFFKKLTFLVNKQHYFCMNYYVDEQNLEIAEKNVYTAIEIGTLIPLQGDTTFEKFYADNNWIREFLPNKIMRVASAKPAKRFVIKSILEYLLNNAVGNVIDTLLMKVTTSRWSQKTEAKKLNSRGIVLAMAACKHCAKPDPRNFQTTLVTKYEIKVSQLLKDHERSLAH